MSAVIDSCEDRSTHSCTHCVGPALRARDTGAVTEPIFSIRPLSQTHRTGVAGMTSLMKLETDGLGRLGAPIHGKELTYELHMVRYAKRVLKRSSNLTLASSIDKKRIGRRRCPHYSFVRTLDLPRTIATRPIKSKVTIIATEERMNASQNYVCEPKRPHSCSPEGLHSRLSLPVATKPSFGHGNFGRQDIVLRFKWNKPRIDSCHLCSCVDPTNASTRVVELLEEFRQLDQNRLIDNLEHPAWLLRCILALGLE